MYFIRSDAAKQTADAGVREAGLQIADYDFDERALLNFRQLGDREVRGIGMVINASMHEKIVEKIH
ncbi:MAG: hypothetical protein AB7O26_18625 [Planctomycetaceae bacterium]